MFKIIPFVIFVYLGNIVTVKMMYNKYVISHKNHLQFLNIFS